MMKVLIVYILLVKILYASAAKDNSIVRESLPEDGKFNFTELCIKYGKPVKEHKVVTEDGYILTIFHVSPARLKAKQMPPVLLLHGIMDSADSFVLRGNTSLAVKLVENGYDVWVGNARGNKYGRHHRKLNPDRDKRFWDFSFHESGYYDIPAMIDYVLKNTGYKTLKAVAHSQGTTEFFVMGSTRPEYSEKIDVLIALAPVAFLNHLQPPVSYLIEAAPTINFIIQATGSDEILGDRAFYKPVMEMLCAYGPFRYELCVDGVIFAFGGNDRSQFEKDFLPVVIGHVPCGTSRRSLLHWVQTAQSKTFAQFDYGPDGNLAKYKSLSPPHYNLAKNNMTIALFFGQNDGYSKVKDIRKLRKLLPNVVEYHKMEPENWNHFDFVWGRDMDKFLYPPLFNVLQKYNQR